MGGTTVARVAACALTLTGFFGAHALRAGVPDPPEQVALERVPYRIAHWSGRDLEVDQQVLDILRPDGFLLREYAAEGELPLQLYVDYHRVQRLGATIHSPQICYPGAGWQPTQIHVTTVRGDGWERPACWLRLRSDDRELMALYWYESRWGRSARETDLKLGIVRSAFTRQPSDAALLRFATPLVENDEEGARRRILRFVEAAGPALQRELPFRTGG